jgi:hypothetical protein
MPLIVLGFSVALCGVVHTTTAQVPDIKKIEVTLVNSPQYQLAGGVAGAADTRDRWLQIQVEFETTGNWTDELTFKTYVLAGSGANTKLLVGDITYLNIPRKASHLSYMYMHPNSVKRFMNGELPPRVGIQILYKGRTITQMSWPGGGRERWWEAMSPDRGYVIGPQLTPFSVLIFDRVNPIKQDSTP